MASTRTNTRPLGQPSSPRRQGHATVPIRGSSIVHVGNRPVLPDAAKRRSLSKSLTEFFTKLRPSKRPERGGTARLTAEHASTRPTPLVGCRKKRSRSLGPHDPDTIPPDRWNTAITPPRRAHSVGNRARRKPISAAPPASPERRTATTMTTAPSPPTRKLPPIPPKNRSPPKRHDPATTHPSPAPPHFITHHQHHQHHSHNHRTLPIPPPPNPQQPRLTAPAITTTTPRIPTPQSRDLYAAHRAHRHERRTLLSSGDFLGVTGANPYTGEPDIVTPPTSTSSAIVSSSLSSSSSSSYWPTSSVLAALAQGGDGGDGGGGGVVWTVEGCGGTGGRRGRGREAGGGEEGGEKGEEEDGRPGKSRERLEKGLRRMAKEEARLCRAEVRKEMVREVLMQGGRVKWRKEEGGWSSVAEPKLSPILQSPQDSGKSSGSGRQEGMRLARQHGDPFLAMAAAARGPDSCRRRYATGEGGIVLAQRQQPGHTKPVMVVGQKAAGGLAALSQMTVRFCLPPVVPRRKSSHQWETSHMPFPLAEWELGRLIAIPVDLRRLSEDCRRQQIFTGRVLELDNLDLAARYPSVCTRITTTTGFERSQPRPLVVGHLFGAMLDRLREAPLTRRALTPRALSRPTSTRSSTTRSSNGCSDRLGSPSSMQLSVWPSVSNLDLQTTKTTTSAWKMLRTRPEQENRIPLQPPKPGPDSVTMSLPTEQEAAAPGQENVAPTPVQHMHGAAADHSREKPDWAMRKTMRNFLDIHPTHHSNNEEPGSPRSSPTCTRTSTSPIALALPLAQPQPQPSKATTSAQRQDETAVTIARASARIAFTQNPDSRRTLPALMLGRTPPKAIHWPVSAPRPGRAKPASAAGTELTGPGSGQQGKGKGKKGGAKKEKKTTTSPEESEGGHKEKGKAEGGKEKEEPQKKKGKGEGSLPAAPAGRPEVEAWMRNAVTMLARVVGAYWQAVSPVFDGNSELRKRLDGAQATRGDAVVCVLAVVFLFLVASVGVWVVRGVVGLVRLLGELGVVLGTVAGLRY